jgi:hypothetical protein
MNVQEALNRIVEIKRKQWEEDHGLAQDDYEVEYLRAYVEANAARELVLEEREACAKAVEELPFATEHKAVALDKKGFRLLMLAIAKGLRNRK